jgi:hypothetical protein
MMRVAAGVPMSASTKKSNCAASLTLLKLRSNRNRFAEGDKMKETECFAKPGEISIDNRHSVYCVRSPLLLERLSRVPCGSIPMGDSCKCAS